MLGCVVNDRVHTVVDVRTTVPKLRSRFSMASLRLSSLSAIRSVIRVRMTLV